MGVTLLPTYREPPAYATVFPPIVTGAAFSAIVCPCTTIAGAGELDGDGRPALLGPCVP